MATYASALVLIKMAGGLYLLWLAYKAFRSAAASHDLEASALDEPSRHLFRYARRGFAIQMTNPKAALAWIAIISLGLRENAPLWVALSIVIGTAIRHQFIALHGVAFSTPAMVRLYSRARKWIQAALGTFFALAGVRLLAARL